MTPFLITGLPRSRTAWMAVVSGALHEPERLPLPWEGGVSDHGLSLRLAEILETVQPRTLIIERPIHEVARSLKAYVGNSLDLDLTRLCQGLIAMKAAMDIDHPLIKRVAFHDLNDISVVRDCLAWLGAPEPPNLPQLQHMVIQSDLGHNIDRLKRAA